MTTAIKHLRKIVIFLIGMVVLIIGFILVPLPGPGLLVLLLGFMILSTEFSWAHKHTHRLKSYFKNAFDKVKEAARSQDDKK